MTIHRTIPMLALTLLAAWALAACSQDSDSKINIEEPFAHETIGLGTTGAAYMLIQNSGAGPDRLIAAATPNAGSTELHTHIKDGDTMRMRKVDGIDIPAGEIVALAPGGLHVMLFDLAAPLAAGDMIPLNLTFENAGDMTIDVSIVPTGDRGGHSLRK